MGRGLGQKKGLRSEQVMVRLSEAGCDQVSVQASVQASVQLLGQ
jgi:hypothetical protein